MSSPIDLSRLPAPAVVEILDYEQILAERKAALLDLVKPEQRAQVEATLALESEPLTILLQESALRELTLRNRINKAALAVMLPYAEDEDLDNIGANFDTARLEITPADPTASPPVAVVNESDAAYQLRIQEAFDGLSVAGPGAAYRRFARSASGRVADVGVISPEPCDITVAVLSIDNDGIADADLLATVKTALSQEDLVPLGDRITVQSADIIEYDYEAILYIGKGPEGEIIKSAALKKANELAYPLRPMGRSVYCSAHSAAVHVEGVIKVVLVSPANDIELTALQAARCRSINITTQVLDE